MSNVILTGDTHGEPIRRFSYRSHPELKSLTKDDFIIILGDFGVPWPGYEKDNIFQFNWMNEHPETFVVLLGNHDNWDWALSLPVEENVHGKIRVAEYNGRRYENIWIIAEPTVLYLPCGQCMCIPGASCHDGNRLPMYLWDENFNHSIHFPILRKTDTGTRDYKRTKQALTKRHKIFRVEGESWWPQEEINFELARNLIKDNPQVDYIFSHDAPAIQLIEQNEKIVPLEPSIITPGEWFLEDVRKQVDFDLWFHGHLHQNRLSPKEDNRVFCLYNEITKII